MKDLIKEKLYLYNVYNKLRERKKYKIKMINMIKKKHYQFYKKMLYK